MTTILAARSALVTAVGASDSPIDPPACYVYSRGSDLELFGGSQVDWGFRVTCAVGYQADDGTASAALAALVSARLTTLWGLAGWRVESVGQDQIRTIAGGEYFTADINVTFTVEI